MNICAVENCDRKVKSRGWCTKHYTRWRRYKDVNFTHKPQPSSPDRGCSVEGCGEAHDSKGYCALHRQRVERSGTTETTYMPPGGATAEERLNWYGWDVTESGCWEFKGPRMKAPFDYGRIGVTGRDGLHLTHRLAYEIWVGPIPEELPGMDHRGVVVRHSCDNPPCINPDHLVPGTHADNMGDVALRGRGRGNGIQGEDCSYAKLTEDQVREIRASTEFERVLGERYGVSGGAIGRIRRRENWKHVK